MSKRLTPPPESKISTMPPRISRNDRLNFLVLMWAVALFSLFMSSGLNHLSTDDAMRLVGVRDFLAGQGWFDLTQYRLNPPNGVEIHWSRLIDLPLALLIKFGSMFVRTSLAEQFLLAIWPSALLLAFLSGIARLASELAGYRAVPFALVLSVLMAPVMQHFRTGAIDHHNVQLVLMAWSLAIYVRSPLRQRDGFVIGGLSTLSIAIGPELIPVFAGLGAIVALRWIVDGDKIRLPTIAYGISLAGGILIFAMAVTPPSKYFVINCETISIAHVGAVSLGGLGLASLAAMSRLNSVSGRLLGAFILMVLIAVYMSFGVPECLSSPYAKLDPRLTELWLSFVSEARSVWSMMRDLPEKVAVYFGIPLAGLMLAAIRCLRESDQRLWTWIACAAIQTVLVLCSFWELRFTAGANALGAALVPAALLRMLPAARGRPSYFGVSRGALAAILVLNPLVLVAGGTVAARAFGDTDIATQRANTDGIAGACRRRADYAPLASLPRGHVLAFIDAGPFILLETEHSVLAAPLHRNQAGNIAMFDAFLAAPEDAKLRITAQGISYVAFCPGAPERHIYAHAAPDGLVSALSRNNIPDFLKRIPLSGTDLIVYRVTN